MNEQTMTLGFNTRGTEATFETMLRRAINERTTPYFRYLELGLAEGVTLGSVADLVRSELTNQDFQCIGVDLLGGEYFNANQFLIANSSFNIRMELEGNCRRKPYVQDRIECDIRILLLKGDKERAMVSPGCVNFALIDGCHGAPCVEKDFLSIEAGLAPGGIVAFHDAGVEDQGIHFQKHCQMPISVVEALDKLDLLKPPSADWNIWMTVRPGWKFIGSVDGDKSPGNLEQNGHGFVFFQKVKP
jgi:hypothetical protein